MNNKNLLQVIIALVLAVVAGYATGPDTVFLGVNSLQFYNLIGQLFLNALTLVVVPLVVASIITGTATMGRQQSFGRLGMMTFGMYLLTATLGVLTGWFFVMVLEPGVLQKAKGMVLNSAVQSDTLAVISKVGQHSIFDTLELILLKLVPSNIIDVASQGQMLGLILFSIIFGFFISKIDVEAGIVLQKFWEGMFQVMMKMTRLVMRALPIGVFGLVAKVVATTGFASVAPIAYFFMTVLIALGAYSFVVLPLLLKFLGRVSPLKHFKAVSPALLTAFFTSSTAATLPVTFKCVEEKAKVSNTICSFTIPLAASLNLAGSACYTTVAVMFICQSYGYELTLSLQMFVVLMTVMTSMGMGGIPSASLAAIILILQTIGIPKEGVVLIMAVERVLDMFRTSVNVLGNTCCAVLVAKLEGEKYVLA